MRLVVQRANSGSVHVDGKLIGEIGVGVVVLCGIHKNDKEEDLDFCVDKLLSSGYWDGKTCDDVNGGILLVSQFTLQARVGYGRKPDYSHAMPPDEAKGVFDTFVDKVRARYNPELVATGEFGGYMDVHIEADGPYTVTFDSFNQ